MPRLVREVPLLPPSFYGIDWATAAPAARVSHAADPRVQIEHSSPRANAALALEVTTAGGLVYRTPGADAAAFAARGVTRVVLDRLEVRASMPAAHARRLVAAAFPRGADGWLLGGVAMLGALFVVGTAVELRREHQLVEERRRFVSTVSHELRTPLAHIVLLSETLLGPAAQTAEQRQRWLTVIRREAVRLGRLVENVLLHTRGELRDARLDLQPVDVGEVVREVVATMDAAAAAQRSRLRAVAPPAFEVNADAGALRQVLLNLLDNALRYGPEGQTVTLTVTPPRAAGDPLVLTVDDEGTGIPPAERRRVWTPFVRLGDRGGATGGTGLGLSVVRALVHQHGGRVDVGDAPGGGARFLVTLPSRPPGR